MKKLLFLSTIIGAALFGCKPTPYEITRHTEIDAPAEVIYAQVNDHKNRHAWSPWDQMDPDMEKT